MCYEYLHLISKVSTSFKTAQSIISFSVVLSMSQVLLVFFSIPKNEKPFFCLPPSRKPFSMDGSAFSPSYYEQMALFLSHILLTKSSFTAEGQLNILLKHVDPSVEGVPTRLSGGS